MKKAVALKYNTDLPAPFIVAGGEGNIAAKITDLARQHGIQIVENSVVAESFVDLEAGDFIPEEYYQIIAEILIFIKRELK